MHQAGRRHRRFAFQWAFVTARQGEGVSFMAAHASGSRRASHPCALMVIKLSRFARIMGVHRRDDWRKQDASNLTGAAPKGAALSLAGTQAPVRWT